MDPSSDISSLIEGLHSEHESARKYAVFRLQNLLSDPDFAATFVETTGLNALAGVVLDSTGNTQAYALGSLGTLLEGGLGWDVVDGPIIEKAVGLAVAHPLVNIVRNALSFLALVVSRPPTREEEEMGNDFGFRALKPALDNYPSFLESLVQRLSASDHTLCANALLLVNALMRDAVANGGENEWPRFIKRLQDLGVIGGVGMLMRGDAATDPASKLAAAIMEFQGLTKVLLRKWKEVAVNVELPEHKRALKTINLLSKPEPHGISADTNASTTVEGKSRSRRHHPQKWRRLGFETESPAWEFDETGYLGMMDLVDYARRNEDTYQKSIMEQAVQPPEQRCPIARASLSVTLILYEHFEIDESADFDMSSRNDREQRPFPPNATVDQLYRPLLLQWGRLHTAALHAFFRLWKASGAQQSDFYKVEDVIRVTVERIVGAASRKTEIAKVEEELRNVPLEKAREWQMEGLEEVYEDAWGPHLVQVREQLQYESLQFMREQRIRCMLQGCWFPTAAGLEGSNPFRGAVASWRFVRLSPNRRHLEYQNYQSKGSTDPPLTELTEKLDLSTVTSVDSNVSTLNPDTLSNGHGHNLPPNASTETLRLPQPQTKITILGASKPIATSPTPSADPLSEPEEFPLLTLHPATPALASEWLDGLLMLLHQQPITADTNRLVAMMVDWGVRLRMLNLRWEDVDWAVLEAGMRARGKGEGEGEDEVGKGFEGLDSRVLGREVPARDGLWEDGVVGQGFWFQMGES